MLRIITVNVKTVMRPWICFTVVY